MRIALIAFHFTEYASRLATALAQGHDVLLVMYRESAEQELGSALGRVTGNPRITTVFYRKPRPKSPHILLDAVNLAGRIAEFAPDVIHYQESLNYAFMLAWLGRLRRYPLVLTIHDHLPHSGAQIGGRLLRQLRKCLRRIPDAVIVHGARIRSECETLLPWLRGRIVSVPHGPLGEGRNDVPNFNWEPGAVLFFGRIEPYKGLSYLVKAAERLSSSGVHLKVIIAGRGGDLEVYRAKITGDATFELIEKFISPEDVPELFRRANLVVLPYTDATQSGVVAMAMQYGRPVVASDVGSIGEVIRDGINGYLVPPRNADALAHAVRRVIDDTANAVNMATNNYNLARGDFSWDSIALRSAGVYDLAIQHKRGFRRQAASGSL